MVLGIEGAPFKGDKGAKLTLIDFSDYQCPFCARHVRETLPQIESEYIETGKLKYAVLDFPMEAIHPDAFKAAEAARCAGEQGKFWKMHARLFANQQGLTPDKLLQHAQAIGLDVPKFQQCIDSGKCGAKIRKDLTEGQKAGVTGTPGFFLGMTNSNDSKVKILRVFKGAQPYARFKEAIDSLLSSQE